MENKLVHQPSEKEVLTKSLFKKENGVWFANIKPFNTVNGPATKVNVRINHDDLIGHATYVAMLVSDNLEWRDEQQVKIRDDYEANDLAYSALDNTPETFYRIVCKKIGAELIENKQE